MVLLKKKRLFLFYTYVSMQVCTGAHRGQRWHSPGAGITGSCELPDMVLGPNQGPLFCLVLVFLFVF